jgi:hypothetical protein
VIGPSTSGGTRAAARLAYTSGAMLVVMATGERRRVPAGACHVGPYSPHRRVWTVRWRERGDEQGAEVSAADLSAYLLGCIVQYG